jgi:hypothetical protein
MTPRAVGPYHSRRWRNNVCLRRLVRIVVGVGIIGLAYYVITHIALSLLLPH